MTGVCNITCTNCYRINTIRLHFVFKFNLVTNIVSIRHIPSFTKPSMCETGNLPSNDVHRDWRSTSLSGLLPHVPYCHNQLQHIGYTVHQMLLVSHVHSHTTFFCDHTWSLLFGHQTSQGPLRICSVRCVASHVSVVGSLVVSYHALLHRTALRRWSRGVMKY